MRRMLNDVDVGVAAVDDLYALTEGLIYAQNVIQAMAVAQVNPLAPAQAPLIGPLVVLAGLTAAAETVEIVRYREQVNKVLANTSSFMGVAAGRPPCRAMPTTAPGMRLSAMSRSSVKTTAFSRAFPTRSRVRGVHRASMKTCKKPMVCSTIRRMCGCGIFQSHGFLRLPLKNNIARE